MQLSFELAQPGDDLDLRRLLRENPMSGSISVTFEREPGYFAAARTEGPVHQTVVGREVGTGKVAGMACRSVRPRFVNGQTRMMGYMSQLRIDASYGRGLYLTRALAKGFARMRDCHCADGLTPYYLISVAADNAPARRVLSAALAGMPRLREYAILHTYAITPMRRRPVISMPKGVTLEHGSLDQEAEILACLQRNGARYQFAPAWDRETLFSPQVATELCVEEFFLAVRAGKVIGCLAYWNQCTYKQTVVRGYAPALARWRGVANLFAPLGGWPQLPAVNTPFRFAYASHLAIDHDDPRVFAALLRAVYNLSAERGDDYFMIGLAESHPFRLEVTRAYRNIRYTAQLYLAAWEDGWEKIAEVDARAPHPEIATL